MKLVKLVVFSAVILALAFFGFYNPIRGTLPLLGNMSPIQPGTTLWGINQVIEGVTGTEVGLKGTFAMFKWTMPNGGIGFMSFDTKNGLSILSSVIKSGGKGNLVSIETFKTFQANLVADGWTFTKYTALGATMAEELSAVIGLFYNRLGMLDVILVPAMLFTPEVDIDS